jgi:hypothetical protein
LCHACTFLKVVLRPVLGLLGCFQPSLKDLALGVLLRRFGAVPSAMLRYSQGYQYCRRGQQDDPANAADASQQCYSRHSCGTGCDEGDADRSAPVPALIGDWCRCVETFTNLSRCHARCCWLVRLHSPRGESRGYLAGKGIVFGYGCGRRITEHFMQVIGSLRLTGELRCLIGCSGCLVRRYRRVGVMGCFP